MRTYNIDNRGLEPPEPLVRILDLVKKLESGDEIVALMDREPFLLYPELERRGMEWDFEEEGESFTLRIRPAGHSRVSDGGG